MVTRRDATLASHAQKLVEGDMGPGIAHDSRSGSDALTDRRAEADFRRYAAERLQVHRRWSSSVACAANHERAIHG